jgi:hypothetical protein
MTYFKKLCTNCYAFQSNVLQTCPIYFTHPIILKIQTRTSYELGFFGGTCLKTKVGAYVKTTLFGMVSSVVEKEGKKIECFNLVILASSCGGELLEGPNKSAST